MQLNGLETARLNFIRIGILINVKDNYKKYFYCWRAKNKVTMYLYDMQLTQTKLTKEFGVNTLHTQFDKRMTGFFS